jgi:hypothetical protein
MRRGSASAEALITLAMQRARETFMLGAVRPEDPIDTMMNELAAASLAAAASGGGGATLWANREGRSKRRGHLGPLLNEDGLTPCS